MEALNLVLLAKAFLRVVPTFLFLNTPLSIPVMFKILFSLPLSLILSQRLSENYVTISEASLSYGDLFVGIVVGLFISLFFSAAMKISTFFLNEEGGAEESENPWRQITDSFFFIFVVMMFMALKLEKNIIELLAVEKLPKQLFNDSTAWAAFLTDVSWLALKVASFGFVFSLTKGLFEEIYRRLGGESLRIVFSVCAWLSLIIMSPFLIPGFTRFLSGEMSDFWKKWLGVST